LGRPVAQPIVIAIYCRACFVKMNSKNKYQILEKIFFQKSKYNMAKILGKNLFLASKEFYFSKKKFNIEVLILSLHLR